MKSNAMKTATATAMLVLCALSLVNAQYQSRHLFIELERAQAQSRQLDIEWAHAMAPSAKIILYEAKSSGLLDLFACVDLAAKQAESVEIDWPSGEKTRLRDLPAGHYYEIEEGQQTAKSVTP